MRSVSKFRDTEKAAEEQPAVELNTIMDVTQAGGGLGIPGLYVTEDPDASDKDAQRGSLKVRFGLGWAKAHTFTTGQTPAMQYNRDFMKAILSGQAQIAKAVNATVISLNEAANGYKDFDGGVAKKFVIDRHGMMK